MENSLRDSWELEDKEETDEDHQEDKNMVVDDITAQKPESRMDGERAQLAVRADGDDKASQEVESHLQKVLKQKELYGRCL